MMVIYQLTGGNNVTLPGTIYHWTVGIKVFPINITYETAGWRSSLLYKEAYNLIYEMENFPMENFCIKQ